MLEVDVLVCTYVAVSELQVLVVPWLVMVYGICTSEGVMYN